MRLLSGCDSTYDIKNNVSLIFFLIDILFFIKYLIFSRRIIKQFIILNSREFHKLLKYIIKIQSKTSLNIKSVDGLSS